MKKLSYNEIECISGGQDIILTIKLNIISEPEPCVQQYFIDNAPFSGFQLYELIDNAMETCEFPDPNNYSYRYESYQSYQPISAKLA